MSNWKAVEYLTINLEVNIYASAEVTMGLFDIDLSC